METTDLWFSAFLIMRGYKLETFRKINPRKVSYHFGIDKDKWNIERLAFLNSEHSKMKQAIEELKDLAW